MEPQEQIPNLRALLESVGYRDLIDYGEYWRTSAVYRGGDHKTALQIHKQHGFYYDFSEAIGGSLEQLLGLTLNVKGVALDNFFEKYQVNLEEIKGPVDDKPPIIMEKIWKEENAFELVPHYKFYTNSGVSEDVLRFLKSGYCHSDEMSMRYTFPILNSSGQIHGWSGRDTTDRWKQNGIKWKHIGGRRNWVYPVHMPAYKSKSGDPKDGRAKTFPVIEAIKKTRQIILVESIGDMMRLWDCGVRNVLVTFGTTLFSKLSAFIMAQDIDELIIATNNDSQSEINRGKVAAIKMFVKSMSFMDLEKIKIVLPATNDFGVASIDDVRAWQKRVEKVNQLLVYEHVLKYLLTLKTQGKITKAQTKLGKILYDAYTEEKSKAECIKN